MSWKRILWAGAVVFLVLIGGLCILLSTYDYDGLKPQIAEAVRDATGRELVLGGKISLNFGLSPGLVVGNIAFQNAPWALQPDMVKVKRLKIQVALLPLILGHIDVKRFVLIEPEILIETDPSGRSNLSFKTTRKLGPASGNAMPPNGGRLKLLALTVAEVRIERGHVAYENDKTGKRYAVTIDSLILNAKGADSPMNLKLESVYNGLSFGMAGTLGTWTGISSIQDWPFHLTATLGGIHVALNGVIKDVPDLRNIDLNIQAKGKDLRDLKPIVGETLPYESPFEIAARVTDPADKVFRLSSLKAVLGNSDLTGSGEVNLSGKRPTLSAVLMSKELDLRPFLAKEKEKPEETGKSETKEASSERVFSKAPLPLKTLEIADAQLTAQADRILLPEVAIDTFTVDMTLKRGHLMINPLKAAVGGGSLNGSLDLAPEGASAAMRTELEVRQLDVGRMMKELGKEEGLEGHLDLNIDVNGKGISEADLMSNLNGRVVLNTGQGKIYNRYIGLFGEDLSAKVFRLLNPFQKESEYTTVNCFVGGFNIRDGLATTTAFVVDTDQMSVIGEGDVNLRTEQLNLSLNPVPKGGIGAGITGKLSVSLGELTRPFKLAGTLSHPSLGIDTTRAAETIAKAVGGIVLFGPAGIAATLFTGGSGTADLCGVAVDAAKQGVKLSVMQEREKKTGPVGEAAEKVEKGVGKIGKELEGLFDK
jgi:AsmA family protein